MAAAVVTKDTLIGDLLRIDANVAPILLGIGMHCLGCPSSQGETIEVKKSVIKSLADRTDSRQKPQTARCGAQKVL